MFITCTECLVRTGGFFSIIDPPQFQGGHFVQVYHENANPKGFGTTVAEVIDTRRRCGVYEYAVQMESQKIWIPEQFLQGAGGNGGHGSPTKRKRPDLDNGSPTKACLTPKAAIVQQLKNEKETTPPTMLNTPSGETTPGASPSVDTTEGHVFATLIVPELMVTQRALVFATQQEAGTFTQQTQDSNKPVSVSDLVVKESEIVPDISLLPEIEQNDRARAFHARKFHGRETNRGYRSLCLNADLCDNGSRDVDVRLRYTRSYKVGLRLGASMCKCGKHQLQTLQSATQCEPISQDRAGPQAGW